MKKTKKNIRGKYWSSYAGTRLTEATIADINNFLDSLSEKDRDLVLTFGEDRREEGYDAGSDDGYFNGCRAMYYAE